MKNKSLAIKTETYDCPTLIAPNFNRAGGLMDVSYYPPLAGCPDVVRVRQYMPNPASTNLPAITINDTNMTLADFQTFIVSCFERLNVTLVRTVNHK